MVWVPVRFHRYCPSAGAADPDARLRGREGVQGGWRAGGLGRRQRRGPGQAGGRQAGRSGRECRLVKCGDGFGRRRRDVASPVGPPAPGSGLAGGASGGGGLTPKTMSAASFWTPTPGGSGWAQPANDAGPQPRRRPSTGTARATSRHGPPPCPRGRPDARGASMPALPFGLQEVGQLGGVGVAERQAGDPRRCARTGAGWAWARRRRSARDSSSAAVASSSVSAVLQVAPQPPGDQPGELGVLGVVGEAVEEHERRVGRRSGSRSRWPGRATRRRPGRCGPGARRPGPRSRRRPRASAFRSAGQTHVGGAGTAGRPGWRSAAPAQLLEEHRARAGRSDGHEQADLDLVRWGARRVLLLGGRLAADRGLGLGRRADDRQPAVAGEVHLGEAGAVAGPDLELAVDDARRRRSRSRCGTGRRPSGPAWPGRPRSRRGSPPWSRRSCPAIRSAGTLLGMPGPGGRHVGEDVRAQEVELVPLGALGRLRRSGRPPPAAAGRDLGEALAWPWAAAAVTGAGRRPWGGRRPPPCSAGRPGPGPGPPGCCRCGRRRRASDPRPRCRRCWAGRAAPCRRGRRR